MDGGKATHSNFLNSLDIFYTEAENSAIMYAESVFLESFGKTNSMVFDQAFQGALFDSTHITVSDHF